MDLITKEEIKFGLKTLGVKAGSILGVHRSKTGIVIKTRFRTVSYGQFAGMETWFFYV